MGLKGLSLFLRDRYMVDEATGQVGVSGGLPRANVVGVRSGRLAFRVPHNTRWMLTRIFQPVIKLMTSGGGGVSDRTLIYIFKHTPGLLPEYILRFSYHDFAQLTSVQQRNDDNNKTLFEDIGRTWSFSAEDEIAYEFEGTDVIDWTQAANDFSYPIETISGGI